jgi:hypothetical protein
MEEQKIFGKLFNTIPLLSEDHLEVLLQSMEKDSALYLLIQAVKYGYDSGVYSLGESEVISKCIRTLSKIEPEEEGDNNL